MSGHGLEAVVRLLPLIVIGLFGCSDSRSVDEMALTDAADEAGMDTGNGSTQEDNAGEWPAFWELAGDLTIASGVIDEVSSSLRVRLMSETREVLCADTLGIETAPPLAEVPEEDPIYGWWRVYVSEPGADSCYGLEYAFPVPVPMSIGIGAMHPEMRAAVGSDEDLDSQLVGSLNAMYASFDGGDTVIVFGVVGTTEAYAGEVDAASSAPLSDGVWSFEPIYPFVL